MTRTDAPALALGHTEAAHLEAGALAPAGASHVEAGALAPAGVAGTRLALCSVMARPCRLPFEAVRGGQRYSLTICAHQRRRYFECAATVQAMISGFLRTAERERFLILAYCCMPDHVHLLVEGDDNDAQLRRFVRVAKQITGYEFTQRSGQRLWQENYFDRTLRREDAVADVIRYLLNNPIRAGLVEALGDYPYWGSGICSREDLLESIGHMD